MALTFPSVLRSLSYFLLPHWLPQRILFSSRVYLTLYCSLHKVVGNLGDRTKNFN